MSAVCSSVLLYSVTVAVEKERAPLARFGDAAMIGRDRGERGRGLTEERDRDRLVANGTPIGAQLRCPGKGAHVENGMVGHQRRRGDEAIDQPAQALADLDDQR